MAVGSLPDDVHIPLQPGLYRGKVCEK